MTVIQHLALPTSVITSIIGVSKHESEHAFEVLDGYAILCAHGNADGLVRYKGDLLSTRLVLKDLVDNNRNELVNNNVSVIYTLSCYGGLQGTYTYRGITITSIHTEVVPVVAVMGFVDGHLTIFGKATADELRSATQRTIHIITTVSCVYVLVYVVSYSAAVTVIAVYTVCRPPPT